MKERWMLCIDNVDDADKVEVRGILEEVATFADPSEKNGWVVVTSRSGVTALWDSMRSGQNVVLGPLSTENAMRALMRLRNGTRIEDDEIGTSETACLERLQRKDRDEYRSLQELCDCLGGLPLGLVQAGAYMRRFHRSFSWYLAMFREVSGTPELAKILRTSTKLGYVNESQRSILTAWKLNVDKLSAGARVILNAVSLLGDEAMCEGIMKSVLILRKTGSENTVWKESLASDELTSYEKIVLEELVFASSLAQRTSCNRGEDSFTIHRLVRMFVLVDMGKGSEKWAAAFNLAIRSTHRFLRILLENAGKSFTDNPSGYGDRQLEILAHAHAIVRHHQDSAPKVLQKELHDLYSFTGVCLKWSARFREAQSLYHKLLVTLREIYGNNEDGVHPGIAASLHNMGSVYEAQGKLEEAESMYEKSLGMKYSVRGEDGLHPDIAASLHNMGSVYMAQGKLEEAEFQFEKACYMLRDMQGDKMSHLLQTSASRNLTRVQGKRRRLDGAQCKRCVLLRIWSRIRQLIIRVSKRPI